MPFNLEKARAAGATNEQIVGYLAPQVPKFNLEKAKGAKVPDVDIINYLAPRVGNSVDGLEPITTNDGQQALVQTGRKNTGIDTRTGKPTWDPIDTGQAPTSFDALRTVSPMITTKAKIKVYAEERGIPQDRYTSIGDDIYFADKNGVLHKEKANAPLESFGAAMLGDAPTIAGAMAGGIAGAGVMKASHMMYNYHKHGDKPEPVEAAIEVAIAGLTAIGGKFSGGAAKGGINTIRNFGEGGSTLVGGRNLTKAALKEVGTKKGRYVASLIKGGFSKEDGVKMLKVIKEAKDVYGINLSIPQATDDIWLLDRLKYLADLPATARTLNQFKLVQDKEAQHAFQKFVKMTTPNAIPGDPDDLLLDFSKKSIKRVLKVREGKASPIYAKAFDENPTVDVKPVVSYLNEQLKTAKWTYRSDLLKIKKGLLRPDLPKQEQAGILVDKSGNLLKPKGPPSYETSLKQLDDVQKSLSREAQKLNKPGGYDRKRAYNKVKEKLVTQMEGASDTYKRARKIYSDESTEVDKLMKHKGSVIGKIASLEGDTVQTATKYLFNRPPQVINKVMTALRKQNPGSADNIISNYYQRAFKSVAPSAEGDVVNWAGKLRNKIGFSIQDDEMAAAVFGQGSVRHQNFTNFMEVLRRVSSAYSGKSANVARQEMNEQTKSGFFGRTVRAATQPLYTYKRWMGEKILLMRSDAGQKKMAEALLDTKTTPKQLAQLKLLSPKSEKFLDVMGQLFGFTAKAGFETWNHKDIGSSL